MMTVLAILFPVGAFFAFITGDLFVSGLLALVSVMLWRAMLTR